MNRKLRITRDVFETLHASGINMKLNDGFMSLYTRLWQNPRHDGGYRLSESGRKIFAEIGQPGIEVPTVAETVSITRGIQRGVFSSRTLLHLDQRVPCPYYISTRPGPPRLFLYDEKEVVVFTLAGSVAQYLEIVNDPSRV